MKCFYCGEEIEEKEKCPYCGKLEIISPLKLLKYILLFFSLLCFVIGPLVFLDDIYKIIICIVLGIVSLITFFMVKPKTIVYVETNRIGQRLGIKLQLTLLIVVMILIVMIIQYCFNVI